MTVAPKSTWEIHQNALGTQFDKNALNLQTQVKVNPYIFLKT